MADKLKVTEIKDSIKHSDEIFDGILLVAAGANEKDQPLYKIEIRGGNLDLILGSEGPSRTLIVPRWPGILRFRPDFISKIKEMGWMTVGEFRKRYGPLLKDDPRTQCLLKSARYKDVVD